MVKLDDCVFNPVKEALGKNVFDILPEENGVISQEQQDKWLTSFKKEWKLESHVGLRRRNERFTGVHK